MTLFIKLIFSCLVILAATSGIHTKQIKEKGDPRRLVVLKNTNIVMGSSLQSGQVPIIAYSPYLAGFDVSIYTQPNKHCDFTIPGEIGSFIGILMVEQLFDNWLYFVWTLKSKADEQVATISTINMNPCTNVNNVHFRQVPRKSVVAIVPFIHGFDVFTSDNYRASYNAAGQLIEKKSFSISSSYLSISAVSEATDSKGFFIIDYLKGTLNLVKDNGELKKPLLKHITGPAYSNNDQSMYSECSFDNQMKFFIVHCFQYGEDGTKKWNNKVTLKFHEELYVKNLPGGGLVFATLNTANNELYIVEMGPTKANIWSYFPKQSFQTIRLISFDEINRTFDLAYGTRQTKQQTVEESVTLQTYSLQN